MKTVFNKLVREAPEERLRQRIPEIIRAAGQECAVETMDEETFFQALRVKLLEEAQEPTFRPLSVTLKYLTLKAISGRGYKVYGSNELFELN